MVHTRSLQEHGAPSDAVSLGRSLQKLLHRHNVTAFDCVIRMLVTANDRSEPHVIVGTHPVTRQPHAYVRVPQVVDALHAALEGHRAHDAGRAPGHSQTNAPASRGAGGAACEIPLDVGWSAYHEQRSEDERFVGDVAGLGVEPAGAPPFEHNMALYEMDVLLMPGSGLPAQRLAEFFYNMGGELTAVQEDARAYFGEALSGALAWKAAARGGRFVSSSALCCWDAHADGVEHTRTVLRNASLCWKGIEEACRHSYAPLVPSIDALTQGYSLEELLILHTAWADWFYARLPPVQWVSLRLQPRSDSSRLTVVYASSHTFMNHGSHYTLRGVFEAHNDARVRVVQLLMVSDQVYVHVRIYSCVHVYVYACVQVCMERKCFLMLSSCVCEKEQEFCMHRYCNSTALCIHEKTVHGLYNGSYDKFACD
jgi:hypothetical protein